MHESETIPDPWLTLGGMAAYVKRSKSFISREIRAGNLRAVSPGTGTVRRRWLARRSWVDAWLESSSPRGEEMTERLRKNIGN